MHKEPVIEAKKTAITKTDSYIVCLYEGEKRLEKSVRLLDSASGELISKAQKTGFSGEQGEMKLLTMTSGAMIALVGLGKKEDLQEEKLLDAIADGAKTLRGQGVKRFSVLADALGVENAAGLAAQAASLGLHRFLKYKTQGLDKLKHTERVAVMSDDDAQLKQVKEALITADAVRKTRDWTNTPPNIANPESVAKHAKELARRNRLKCAILGEQDFKRMKMGCMLAVGGGSATKPRMVILEHRGGGKSKPVVLVGKGITFDTGGYNLKPSSYIATMKDDKAGAMAVMHVIEAAARLRVKANVVGILVLAENMISGEAYRPDDIITAYNGTTIEIGNTDAEGRLVLADGLSYASKMDPQAIVDIATLTGAATIALGHFTTSLVGSDQGLVDSLKAAGDRANERLWQLPLWDEYKESIKSDVADIKNVSDGPDAGVIIGGIFLKQFVDGKPWAHLDIGSTVWSKADKGIKQKGGTGVCVRTLVELVKSFA